MKRIFTLLLFIAFFISGNLNAQQPLKTINKKKAGISQNLKPTVKTAAYFDVSKPLRDMVLYNKLNGPDNFHEPYTEIENFLGFGPEKTSTKPGKPDILAEIQRNFRTPKAETLILNDSFDGGSDSDNTSSSMPPDTDGDVNENYYVQMINNVTTIFDRSGNVLQGPFNSSDFWSGFGIFDQTNDGDAIALWDEDAQRWLVSQFAVPASDGNYYELIAISQTADPRGSYYRYAFQYNDFNDYPKLAVWPDGYYCGQNAFNGNTSLGIYATVFERDEMIAGNPSARMVNFTDANEFAVFPADADDFTNIPAGAPCYFVSDQVATYTNNTEVYIYQFHVDWNNTSNSTFAKTQTLTVSPYGVFGQTNGDGDSQAEQPGVSDKLDLLHYRTMFRSYYRPFSDHNSLLMCRTVDPNNNGADDGKAGIRWYEFRNTGIGSWSVYQQGTYAPSDGKWRWMPSMAMNAAGDIAIGYSISDATSQYPSLAAVARYATDPLNVMTTNEKILFNGSASQHVSQGYTRWGDYSMLSIDPSDDYSFWFTSEYTTGGWNWKTRITHFQLPVLTPPTVSNVSPSSLYEDRGKQLTITGSDLVGSTFEIGGVSGSVVSNDGSTAVVTFPAGNYTDGTLTVTNSGGNDTYSVTVNTRNTIPVVSGAGATSDNHPTIQSACNGLSAWYGSTAFNAGDLAGTKTIEVSAATYTEGVTLNSSLNPTAANPLIIQPATGAAVIVDATGNNYGFDLSTVDYVQLKGFTVHDADLDNIYAQGNNVTISYNKSYGCAGGAGIMAETGTPFTITNNLLYNNFYGLHIKSSNSDVVKNNTLADNGGLYTTTATFFTQGFNSTTIPANWADEIVVNTNPTHPALTYVASSTNPTASPSEGSDFVKFNSYNCKDGAEIRLKRTTSISTVGYSGIKVNFAWYQDNGYSSYTSEGVLVQWSTDGSTWNDATFYQRYNATNGWTSQVCNLPAGADGQANLYIAFKFHSQYGNNCYADNVSVTGSNSVDGGSGLYVESGTGTSVQNNIFSAQSGNDAYYALSTATGITVTSDYNTYYTTNTNLFDYNGTQGNTGPMGANDITTTPSFVGAGDYHIFSTNGSYHGGEWPPLTATAGAWTNDASTSTALDAGNPVDAFANEPASGGRINQGAYGNTLQASKSSSCTYPTTQATSFTATPSVNSINVGWTRGDGSKVIVLAHQATAVNSDPVDGTTYTANAAFGSGTQIGTGNYVIYNGTGSSVNVTGLSSGVTYYFAVYEYDNAGKCYLKPALTGNSTTTVITFDWTGATNSDWFNTSNWSGGTIPGSTNDVTIANVTNQPIIDDGIGSIAQCNNITIDAGADITIDPNGYMTVSGAITNNGGNAGLVINSDATGTGSLIQNTSGGVDATVKCYLASSARQWHMVSSPITAAPFTIFPSTSNLYYYDESTADYWTGVNYDAGSTTGWTAPAGNMTVGKGYVFNYFANTLTYTGQLNDNSSSSAIAVPYTNNGVTAPNASNYDNFDGWSLIGNPYTSAIDWDDASVAHAAANLNDAVYTYEDGTLHNYTSYVGGVGTNGGTRYIPAMQGFFVKSDNTETGGTLNIGAAARVHNTQSYWKGNTPNNFLRLQIAGNGYTDETVIRLNSNATYDMDNGLDAYKLFTWDSNVPQIYTVTGTGNTEFSINTVPDFAQGTIEIPLKVVQTGDNYKIEITEFNFSDVNVYLKDNLKNITTEIGLNDVFELNTDASDNDNRFELVFEKSTSGILLAENTSVTIYPNPNRGQFWLSVGNKTSKYNVKIENVTGQVIFNNKFFGNTTKMINLSNQTSGIYFVTIQFSDNSAITKKIVIE